VGVAVNTNTDGIYVTNNNDNTVSVINGVNNKSPPCLLARTHSESRRWRFSRTTESCYSRIAALRHSNRSR
jgi:DNA-binding beta-propeller fold protein YncE